MRILNHITWKKVTQFEHPATINNTKAVSIFSLSSEPWNHSTLFVHSFIHLFTVCCVSRLCIRKWRKGQQWAATTCLYTTSRLALLSSTRRANVHGNVFLFEFLTFVISFTNSFVVVVCSRRDLPAASPISCGQTRPGPSQSQNRCLYFGI